jgi:polyisoprenoid-binding protein YceI
MRLATAGVAWMAIAGLGPCPAAAEMAHWVTVPRQSIVSFDASFPPSDFSGYCREVSGDFEADAADLTRGVTGRLTVQVAGLSTGNEGRDKEMWKALAVHRHPTMYFVIQTVEAPSFPPGVAEHPDTLLTIQGRLSIAGVERVKRFSGRVRLKQGRLWVRGRSGFRPPPRAPAIASVRKPPERPHQFSGPQANTTSPASVGNKNGALGNVRMSSEV